LKSADYHLLLSHLAQKLNIKRPVTGVNPNGKLVTGAEIRALERETDYLVYASNLTAEPVELDLKAASKITALLDLRSLKEIAGCHIKLGPWQETIYRVEKLK
jgi:hypothetical protein